jgi:hypothetical protein
MDRFAPTARQSIVKPHLPQFFGRLTLWRQSIAVLLAALVVVGGMTLTVAIERAQMVIIDIEGSTQAPSFAHFKLFFTVGGISRENFVTVDPAGTAFLSWRYNRPVSLTSITHMIVGQVETDKIMRAMSVQYKDQSGVWTEALRANWPETDLNVGHTITLAEPHSRAVSPDWRVVALEGGTGGEMIMGSFSPLPNQRAGLLDANHLNLDGIMLATFWIAAAILATFNRRKAGVILFLGGCFATVAVVNIVIFGLLQLPVLWAPDSNSYLIWPPSPYRMPGISLVYTSLFRLFGFSGLHVFQVNMVLGSYLGALGCMAAATKRYWPFILLTVLPVIWGNFVLHASFILSEPWFMTAVLMSLSGLLALIFGAGWKTAAWSGSGLLLGICVKPVAAALIVPTVLAYRFVPGTPGRRRQVILLATGPAVLAYLAMSIYGLAVYGRFSPQNFGGTSLAGHVAWMLRAEDLPETYREVGKRAVADLGAAYAAMPAMTDPEGYVNFTTNTFNIALYSIILPQLWDRVVELKIASAADPERPRKVVRLTAQDEIVVGVARDQILGAWAQAAIIRDPIRYLANCALHYWGLWRDSIRFYYTIGQARSAFYHTFQSFIWRDDAASVNPYFRLYRAYNKNWRRDHESHVLTSMQYAFVSIQVAPSARYGASGLMLVSLGLSALYFVPVQYSVPVAAMIIWALYVNAFISGQALFQVTLSRFGEMIVPLVPILAGLVLIRIQELIRTGRDWPNKG